MTSDALLPSLLGSGGGGSGVVVAAVAAAAGVAAAAAHGPLVDVAVVIAVMVVIVVVVVAVIGRIQEKPDAYASYQIYEPLPTNTHEHMQALRLRNAYL